MPEVPTVAETLPGFACENWFGLLAPPSTPAAIISPYMCSDNGPRCSTPPDGLGMDAERGTVQAVTRRANSTVRSNTNCLS